MIKSLWLNSGGKDAHSAIRAVHEMHPDYYIKSFHILTDDVRTVIHARNAVFYFKLESFELDYAETRKAISGSYMSSTIYWSMENHYRALQYALENDFSVIFSGQTNRSIRRDNDDSDALERLFDELQDYLEVPISKRVTVLRPIRTRVTN